MIEFTLGIVYASFLEWWIHKKLFHEVGRKKNNWFSFHLRDHHATAKKNNFIDKRISRREAVGLCALGCVHSVFCYISVLFFAATVSYALAFFVLHNYSHKNPAWTKKWMPWHWNHHMKNPNTNWNVVLPIADWILGTNK